MIASAVGSTATKPGTSGAKGACLDSCGVADSEPYVRPWKPRCTETMVPPRLGLARDLERRLVGLGAGVGEVDLAAQRGLGQALGQAQPRLGVEEVADVDQALGLLADRRDDGRVAVPEAVDGQAGLEVEVLVALVVPQPRALAADELDAQARVGGDQVVALEQPAGPARVIPRA